MKITHFFQRLQDDQTWLLGIGVGLIALHLTLTWQTGQDELVGTSILFWSAVGSLIWKKHQQLNLQSSYLGSFLGLFFLTIVLIKSSFLSDLDFFLRILPLLSALSLGLIASGIKGLKQYWQELFILCFFIPHSGMITQIFDISSLTARATTYLLLYLGFEVKLQGVNIIMPTGSVEVNTGCSGYSIMLQLLGIAAICLVMFPTTTKQKIILPILAVFIGFIVNLVRVSLMAILAAYARDESFKYWHEDSGSLIFSVIAVAIFCSLYYWKFRPDNPSEEAEINPEGEPL
jgi:cyanoexosortase A